MAAIKLAEGIYSVGALNPNLRVFDIIMKTEYGTTYNAYVVKGQDKTALIETCHGRFFDEFINNVKEVVDPAEIDYIIFNHTEPDHSGALHDLLELCPKAVVYGSAAAGNYLKEIVNGPFPFQKAAEGMTLDLGGRTLKFTMAPFLHWPDSMFTLVEGEDIIFTCDFFGSHYCEPRMIDKYITYPEAYEDALKNYYDAIFGPFAPYVQKGLQKLEGMQPKLVCTSHGPVLTEARFGYVKGKYEEWSQPVVNEKKTIEIFYVSAYHCTARAAEKIKEGIQSVLPEANVNTYDIIQYDICDLACKLARSDAFLVGTPTINKDMLAPVTNLLSHVDVISNKGKPCAAFGSYGWSGEGVPNAVARLKALGLGVFEESYRFKFVPSDQDLQGAFEFGQKFAQSL